MHLETAQPLPLRSQTSFLLYSTSPQFYSEDAQMCGSPAADYSKTTDSENHFFYQMAAAYFRRRRSGGAGVGQPFKSSCRLRVIWFKVIIGEITFGSPPQISWDARIIDFPKNQPIGADGAFLHLNNCPRVDS